RDLPKRAAAFVLRVAGSRRWRRLFIYVVPAVRAAPSRGRRCLGRTGTGGVTRSALALLVTGIRADDHDARVATDHLAVVTDRLDARLNLHWFLLPGQLLVAVGVGAELDDHAVLGKDADVVLAHLPGDVREHLVPVVELDPEARIRKRLRDRSLDLDHAVLLRHASPISRPGGPAAEFRILWSCA